MQCPRCQHENPQHAKFCLECGARLALTCAKCRAELPGSAKFCLECGEPVARQTQSRSPESYTPMHLAEKILTSKSAIEGERKQVTVLFCDLVNSTGLAERIGPEEMHSLLNHFFDFALEGVHRYEGTINQFLGDGFMALFGAPIAHEDHAHRAVLAALTIRRRLAEHRSHLGDATLAIRMGLNTGPVVVGSIGDNLRMDYTAIGDTTNLAARLQQLAEPGEILVSETTSRLVTGHVQLEGLGPTSVKGKSEPIKIHRVVGLGPRDSSAELTDRRFLTGFFGRERELLTLSDLLIETEQGRGQVVGIVGEPGTGKSRLIHEFRKSWADRGLLFFEGRCLSYGSNIPFLPIVDVIRTQCAIAEADTPETIGEKVRTALVRASLDVDETAPYLLHLLGLKAGSERIAVLSPEGLRERTFEVLCDVVLRRGQHGPVVFVVEDLHWIDRTSEELLATLGERLTAARVFLLTTYRPGYRPPWINKSYATQLVLRPLSPPESRQLVESTVRGKSLPESLVDRILARAEGNAFFLEELTRAVAERGAAGSEVPVPDSIQAVLAARIDRLPDEAKRLLQAGAVIGREFSPRLLTLMWDGVHSPEESLHDLRRHEFLYERAVGDETLYVFKHALTQEVAYESILGPRRRALHVAVGQALETVYSDRLEEAYARLAYHYSRAADAERSVEYLARFAETAARVYSHAEAATALQEALFHADRLPEARDRKRLELVLAQAESLHFLGRRQEAVEVLLTHRERLEQLADAALAGPYYFRLGFTYSFLGNREQAKLSLTRAFSAATEAGDEDLLGRVKLMVGVERAWAGHFREGAHLLEEATSLLARTQNRWWLGWAHYARVLVLTPHGETAQAFEAAAKLETIAEALGDRRLRTLAAHALGQIHAFMGDGEAAVSVCQRALDLSPDPFETAAVLGYLGFAYLEKGDTDQATSFLESAVEQANLYRSRQICAWFSIQLGRAYLQGGRLDRARESIQTGLEISQQIGYGLGVAEGRRTLGLVEQAHGALAEAEQSISAALEKFKAMDARFGVAQCHVDLAMLAHGSSDHSGSLSRLRQAHALFAELGARRQCERIEQLGRLAGGTVDAVRDDRQP
jgi:class 3 adenylate cyclase/tetratricopeptide (TPR) repeat protein